MCGSNIVFGVVTSGRKLKVFWWLKLIGYLGPKDLRSFRQGILKHLNIIFIFKVMCTSVCGNICMYLTEYQIPWGWSLR